MKTLFALIVSATTLAAAQTGAPTAPNAKSTPAQLSMTQAREAIQEKPEQYLGYNLLAAALVRRARETSDPSFYAEAATAVQKSMQLTPKNFETEKIRVSILLGEHDFPAALGAANALNKQVPDDVTVYSFQAEANAELGNYQEAETAAQWMLNLRPGNVPALIQAAQLRRTFGDLDGSYELFQLAYESTLQAENTDRAWLLTQMGDLRLNSGKTDDAEKLLQQALDAFPKYPLALKSMAEVRTVQTRSDDALGLLRQCYQFAPRAENLYALAKGLHLAKHEAEANQAFAAFEAKSLEESDKKDNSNRDLVFYYTDQAKQPAKALRVAELEYAWRKDVYTLDAYAWALHTAGQNAEALRQIKAALSVGIRDARFFGHAGEISFKSGDARAAELYLKQAVELNPFDSGLARVMLATLAKSGRSD